MFQEIFSNGLTLVPTVFYTVILNTLWLMLTGQRFAIKEHGKLRYFAQQALRTQRSVDITGNTLSMTPWIRYIVPYYSGFTDLIESSRNTLKYMEVIPCIATWYVQVLRSPKEAFAAAMQSWRERCEKCVCLQGDYAEK